MPEVRTTLRWFFCAPRWKIRPLVSLFLLISNLLTAQQPARLQIATPDGAELSVRAGTVAYQGLAIEVRDEAGKPVPRAAVTFRLPESGPSGVFPNGGKVEEVLSNTEGRADVWGIRWGPLPGVCRISITANAGEASAGIVLQVRLTVNGAGNVPRSEAAFEIPPVSKLAPLPAEKPTTPAPTGTRPGVMLITNRSREHIPNPRSKWIIAGLGIAGAVGGGIAWRMMHPPGAAATSSAPQGPPLSLATSSIAVGKP